MRLIDAYKLKEEVGHIAYVWSLGRANGKTLLKKAVNDYTNAVIAKIDNAPTIESVEVVRCHDCKNFDADNHHCKVWNQSVYEWFDFCSRRKGGEDE